MKWSLSTYNQQALIKSNKMDILSVISPIAKSTSIR
jgi:hypothetical protein